ncbi:Arc family DNA-binding protein [Thiothrix litoralis]|uniref:Arc family DNA-binding protein n=1 Tax=Thiothrix litoralis TaxID=2891210 RepID=A0ABX7WW43_9GAMM|nr:Arc family DNA-binding protein [Thiothrix litoralis]QTR47506.1 Arc family DNA-binding protein [Thiothrix litoralis]
MEYQRITLRIPLDLHQELMDAADEGSRSMNAEVIARLRLAQSLPEAETKPITERRMKELMREVLIESGVISK